MPQIRAIALAVVPPSLSCLLLGVPTFCQLLNVVHHAIHIPLRVDLLAPTVVKAGQAFFVPDVGKHRLNRANALAAKNWNLTLFGPLGVQRYKFKLVIDQVVQYEGEVTGENLFGQDHRQ